MLAGGIEEAVLLSSETGAAAARRRAAAARPVAEAAWVRYVRDATPPNLGAWYRAEAAVRRAFDEAAGTPLRLRRTLRRRPAARPRGRRRGPARIARGG